MSVRTAFSPIEPDADDVKLARRASPVLAEDGDASVYLRAEDGEELPLPASAVKLLQQVLGEFAQGHAVALAPLEQEVSTQKAADILNVSRPYLIGLLEAAKLPFRYVGTHRRIRLADVLAYRTRSDADAERAYNELVAQSQQMGLYE